MGPTHGMKNRRLSSRLELTKARVNPGPIADLDSGLLQIGQKLEKRKKRYREKEKIERRREREGEKEEEGEGGGR